MPALRSALATILLTAAPAAAAVDFTREIAPIFAKRCLQCHGPDKQEGGLRLDRKRSALQGGDSGVAIAPGKSAESPLIDRVAASDPDHRMPPEGAPLSAAEIELLRRWIDAGADWPEDADPRGPRPKHWAFQPPSAPEVPTYADAAWARNPIDCFIRAKLERAGLSPNPEADRYALLRRLSLDLVGLPPTPQEADAFARDPAPNAYERQVDRLLASPAYGERWARRWLDLARYADTNGYEKDRQRSIWPYRDWVVDALNRDLPFDRFTILQLAGDMLPNAGIEERIATGFHRNTMINEEGGIDVGEFRFHAIVDRTNTTATTWLGLTLGCAQCHSHKYDPFSQREYYRFFAYFNNCDEPEIAVADEAVDAARERLLTAIAAIDRRIAAEFPRLEKSGTFAAWVRAARGTAALWTVLRPSEFRAANGATLTPQPDGSILASGDCPNRDVYVATVRSDLPNIAAIRLEVLADPRLPMGGPGRAPFGPEGVGDEGDFFLSEIVVERILPDGSSQPVPLAGGTHDYAPEKRSAAQAVDGDLDTGWSVTGATGKNHQAVFLLREPLAGPGEKVLRVTLAQQYIHQMTIGRFRLSATGEVGAKAKPLDAEAEALLLKPEESLSAADRERLRDVYLSAAPELADLRAEKVDLLKKLPRRTTTMVLEERKPEHARTTHLYQRGEYLRPAQPVEPGLPEVLSTRAAPADRLELARWLVSDENPLTARVVMNRHWQAFFGQGLVRTPEDFGAQGAAPSHPELLDWLAREFLRQGWSQKAMHRRIVTSAAYRQSTAADASKRDRDPDNALLSRGPRLRLDAEIVRDQALAASGLLSRKIGGPSVFPPQPEGVIGLAYPGFTWTTETGENRYRRGLYTFSKRASPYAAFTLFDAPSGETCTARRVRSNTPLQALVLLNDVVFLEAARALARRAVAEAEPSPESIAARVFRLVLLRPPTATELSRLTTYHSQQARRFRNRELDAAAVLGDAPKCAVDDAELAAWTVLARAVLNLDEAVHTE